MKLLMLFLRLNWTKQSKKSRKFKLKLVKVQLKKLLKLSSQYWLPAFQKDGLVLSHGKVLQSKVVSVLTKCQFQ